MDSSYALIMKTVPGMVRCDYSRGEENRCVGILVVVDSLSIVNTRIFTESECLLEFSESFDYGYA
jgi:hypothetical protein